MLVHESTCGNKYFLLPHTHLFTRLNIETVFSIYFIIYVMYFNLVGLTFILRVGRGEFVLCGLLISLK